MKTKILISNACAAIIVALSLVGCSDFDNGFTEKEIAFQEAFKKEFGEIDPEQDWNLATRGTLNINLTEEANVKIYSTNPINSNAVLMANYKGVSAPSTLGFDMPKGTEQVFVQAISDRGVIVNGYVNLIDGEGEVQASDEENEICSTSISGEAKEIQVYHAGVDWNYTAEYKTFQLYNLDGVSKTETETFWQIRDYVKILGEDGVFAEKENNWEKWIESGVLKGDVVFVSTGGPLSVTLNYRCTSNANQFAYFYYEGTTPPSDNIKLYNLIPDVTAQTGDGAEYLQYSKNNGDTWTNIAGQDALTLLDESNGFFDAIVKGTTFRLVYFGKDGTEPGTFNFPADINIGFAVIAKDGYPKYPDKTMTFNAANTNYVWTSIQSINPPSSSWSWVDYFDGQRFPTAATFKMKGTTFLGFEDAPDQDGGCDLNDILFWVTGAFKDDDIEDLEEDPNDKRQSWIISAEDLGDTDDIDYNDVVIEVEYVDGDDYITVYPLAAGGTLASYIYFGEKYLGEIHGMLDEKYMNKGILSGDFPPLNVNPGIVKRGKQEFEVPVEKGFSLSTSVVENGGFDADGKTGIAISMGGFNLRVLPQGTKTTDRDGSKEKRIQNEINWNGTSKIPYVICTPKQWERIDDEGTDDAKRVYGDYRWAKEKLPMTEAYKGKVTFADWVGNKNNVDWYKYPDVANTCSTSDVKSASAGSTGGGDDDPQTPTQHNLIVTSSETVNLTIEETSKIQATSSTGTVKYSSDDPNVAEVDEDGTITAIGAGNATITVYVEADDTYTGNSKTIHVTVTLPVVGTSIFEGEKLEEIANNKIYTIPIEACQAQTSCKLFITTTASNDNDRFTKLYIHIPGEWDKLIEEGNGNYPQEGGIHHDDNEIFETECTILSSSLEYIKKKGIEINNEGNSTITKIVVKVE